MATSESLENDDLSLNLACVDSIQLGDTKYADLVCMLAKYCCFLGTCSDYFNYDDFVFVMSMISMLVVSNLTLQRQGLLCADSQEASN